MRTPRPPWLETPPLLAQAYAELDWDLAYEYPQHSVVHRLSRDGVSQLFVKLARTDHYPTLAGEAERMRWARAYLPVPEVVREGSEGVVSWLVTSALPGQDGTRPEQLARGAALVRSVARGLRDFHESAPVADCPFDFRLDAAIEHVRARVRSGQVDQGRDFHPEFAHLTPEEALSIVESTRPVSEDLVVCHGDYCVPNALITEGRVTGYVDLGELGVADRWWDLAVASWSMTWNLGPGFEELFLVEYGAELDSERTRYYRLMYDLVC